MSFLVDAQLPPALCRWFKDKDEDFLILRLPDRFAFLWLRCGNCTNNALGEWLGKRWTQTRALLDKGERFIELG